MTDEYKNNGEYICEDVYPYLCQGVIYCKQDLTRAIRKLCPEVVNETFNKESIDDKRRTFAYALAFQDLKEELNLNYSKCNKMTYNKCSECSHVYSTYIMGGGMSLTCKITGKQLKIQNCPINVV